MKRPSLTVAFLLFLQPLSAFGEGLTLAQCDRLTHPAHGGEAKHRDLGEGRVLWQDWWSMEGTSTDITLMDCDSGAALRFRSAETNMKPGRSTFDRTDIALDVIALHESGARAFATFDRIAADLVKSVRDIDQFRVNAESCACAAVYPDMRGDKAPFVLEIIEPGIGPISK